MLETYLNLLEQGYFEVTFAFEGLANEHAWKRPAPGLLSIGELAGHLAYWQAVRMTGGGVDFANHSASDLALCQVSSPLIDHRFAYYSTTLANPPSEQHLSMTAEQICQELLRVHKDALAHFRALNPDLESTPPGWPSGHTYAESLEYMVFHIAYHTGQMYSVRHLLGEQTPDN